MLFSTRFSVLIGIFRKRKNKSSYFILPFTLFLSCPFYRIYHPTGFSAWRWRQRIRRRTAGRFCPVRDSILVETNVTPQRRRPVRDGMSYLLNRFENVFFIIFNAEMFQKFHIFRNQRNAVLYGKHAMYVNLCVGVCHFLSVFTFRP